jgi:hypothetical protein
MDLIFGILMLIVMTVFAITAVVVLTAITAWVAMGVYDEVKRFVRGEG